jgi:RNA recognition motif-containing protein
MRIYVGNLSYTTSEQSLRDAFEQYGTVDEVSLVTERDTGRSRGFAFVEMGNQEEARQAITALHETELDGRVLTVNEARPQRPRTGGRRFGGERRGGGHEDRGRDDRRRREWR